MCKPTKTSFQAVAGEDCKTSSRGMFMIPTSANYPYAIGRLSDIITPASETSPPMSSNLIRSSDPFQKSIDSWGKLESNFNNMENYKDFLEEDVFEDDWNVYSVRSNKITHDFIIKLRQQHEDELNLLRKITNRQKVLKVHPSKRKLTSQKNKNRPTNMTSRKQLFHEKLENN